MRAPNVLPALEKEMVQEVSAADQTENRKPGLDSLLARIAELIGPVRCELWFGGAGRVLRSDSEVVFFFDSDFELNRVQRHHGIQLRHAVEGLFGSEVGVQFSVLPTASGQAEQAEQSGERDGHTVEPAEGMPGDRLIAEERPLGINGVRERVRKAPLAAARIGAAKIGASKIGEVKSGVGKVAAAGVDAGSGNGAVNRRSHTLEEFWFGEENQLLQKALAENFKTPGHFSPLLIYGPTGVGKSHLLNAICRQFRAEGKLRCCVSLTAEQFLNEFVYGLRKSGLPMFRRKFRDLDLLAIDDIHFLGGKAATINEINVTLDHLSKAGKQVILTTDRMPAELNQISKELSGRLQGGLNCPLRYPGVEGRRWILDSICRQRGWNFSSEVLELVALGIERDCRRLNGALNRLRAAELANGKSTTKESAERDLKDLIGAVTAVTTLPRIEQLVCDACGIPASELRSESRTKRISTARMLAMWLSRQHTNNALSEIGDYFGGRSHSTVVAAQKRIEQWLESGEKIELESGALPLKEAVQVLARRLRVG